MYGIDISRYDMTGGQKNYTCPLRANTEEAYQEASFVIIKATNGESYAYEHIFEPMIERAAKDRMLLGLGHAEIFRTAEKYIERDGITTDELEDLEKYLYKPYKEMGGNGTAETIVHKCHSLQIITADEAARRDKEL